MSWPEGSMDEAQLHTVGINVATNTLVAHSLALALRGFDDPRAVLRAMITAIDEQVHESTSNAFREHGITEGSAVAADVARKTVLSVGQLADNLLSAWGVPPTV